MERSGPSAPFKPPRLVKSDAEITIRPRSNERILINSEVPESRITHRVNCTRVSKDDSDKEDKENREDKEDSEPSHSCNSSQDRLVRPYKRPKIQAFVAPKVVNSRETTPEDATKTKFFLVQWRKKSTRKHKIWEGDGMMLITETLLILKDENNKVLSKIKKPNKSIDNQIICIGNYELEIERETYSQEFSVEENEKPFIEVKRQSTLKNFKNPSLNYKPTSENRRPLYPIHETSLIMNRPSNYTDESIIDVVVDPSLSSVLRPHQKEGVKFLYECVMGFRRFNGNGALLADDMGLGKTLMTITLIWTLYKQNPFSKANGSIVKKTLICCPVTLIDNWKKEFKKWLGVNKFSCLGLNSKQSSQKDKMDIISFGKYKVHQVLIMSYEKTYTCSAELATVGFDLLICDEGHKIKNSNNKALKILTDLNIRKKVLLTGTPIQNDLSEFYTIINFINPGILGSAQLFQKNFVRPILLSREVNCNNPDVKRLGNERSNDLIKLTSDLMLRRTNSILSKFLTDKTDLILFVPPTDSQLEVFKLLLNSKKFSSLLIDYNNNQALSLITLFKKICNSPSLLADDKTFKSLIEGLNEEYLDSLSKKLISGKIKILIPLLLEINNLGEKIVLISNYTRTLNLLETILNKLNLSFLRLDGSVPNNLRSKLVNEFNTKLSVKIFLLSSKSGGMGINLVGASRLILFDNDWNPSTDLQSMARIHRDGQEKPVFIYRIMTVGCIDEKIFQRQLMKNSLSRNFLDNDIESDSNVFDSNDLKNLFEIVEDTICNTHDLLECECEGAGEEFLEVKRKENQCDSELVNNNNSGWVSALEIKHNNESVNKMSKSNIKNELLDYKHFDLTSKKKSFYGDSVLKKIVDSSDETLINFLMMKFTPSNTDSSQHLEI